MDRYEPLKIEEKWQKIWEETEAFKVSEDVPISIGGGATRRAREKLHHRRRVDAVL